MRRDAAEPEAASPQSTDGCVLLVEDDASSRQAMAELLTAEGFAVTPAASGVEALARLNDGIAVIITDLQMPGLDGMKLLEAARTAAPHAPVIMVTGHGTQEIAVRALKSGAFHYVTKPANPEELISLVRQALDKNAMARQIARLHQELRENRGFAGMVGQSPAMRQVFEKIHRVADTRSTVLIEGESGSGKELVARALHLQSARADGPFVAVNCAALPESLVESELFGHERGAFTGASERRAGKFQAAHGGTLLIDEIGEMKLDVQAKLLRAIERRAVTPVGSNREIEVDVRIVASTHRNLRELTTAGTFREDLYYRLHVVTIQTPPLRRHCEDIPILTRYFIEEIARESGRRVQDITPAAQALLLSYSWPGNVRQLRNVLEGIIVQATRETIEVTDLPEEIRGASPPAPPRDTGRRGATLAEIEKEAIRQALAAGGGNRAQASRSLGISVRTIQRKIREYGLE